MINVIADEMELRTDMNGTEASTMALYIFRALLRNGWVLPEYA
jgi:hypothetical protein